VHETLRRIAQGVYVMDPDFQRDFVWPIEKQSRLIESVLMRIPLPVIYLAENTDGKLVVVDGLQRLSTFRNFISDESEVRLALKNRDLNGKRFRDLPPKLKNRIEDAQLIIYLIDSKVPERARLDIFERVNSGMTLTRQQMRNALYQGPATRLLRHLSETEIFKQATGGSLDALSMRDREAINRFVAFRLLGAGIYRDDMDDFLAESLRTLNRLPDADRQQLGERFLSSMRNNWTVFRQYCFRKHQRGVNRRSVINLSLFDVCSVGFSHYDEARVAARKAELEEGFYNLMETSPFVDSISLGTSDKMKVLRRFEHFERMLREVIGAP